MLPVKWATFKISEGRETAFVDKGGGKKRSGGQHKYKRVGGQGFFAPRKGTKKLEGRAKKEATYQGSLLENRSARRGRKKKRVSGDGRGNDG